MAIPDTAGVAARLADEVARLSTRNTPAVRRLRQQYSAALKGASAAFVLTLADQLVQQHGLRWVAYELIAAHPLAFRRLGARSLQRLGRGLNSWQSVDSFARTLSGPAWRDGQIDDALIKRWAHSPDVWWRRAALVSTVALNMRSHGGRGDVRRTIQVCRLLAADHADMVVKALSWALRELIVHDPAAVRAFLREHDAHLAARVKREVDHKLTTGLKNPRT